MSNPLEEIVDNTFFTVTYRKINGVERAMNGRLGVIKHLKVPKRVPSGPIRDYLVNMYELNKGYRTLNLGNILEVRSRGKRFVPVHSGSKMRFMEVI